MAKDLDDKNEEDQLHSLNSQDDEIDEKEFFELLDRQFDHPEKTTVREAIGNPMIRPLSDIAPGELEEGLQVLFDLLRASGVAVEFLFEVDIREQYRFITEELLDEEMDKIYIPDLMEIFTYESFHPNDAEDAKHWAGEFLRAFFGKDEEMLELCLCSDEFYDSNEESISKEQILQLIHTLRDEYQVFKSYSYTTIFVQVRGDYADVAMQTSWDCLEKATNTFVTVAGISNFQMKRSIYGGWDVVQFQFPVSKITS
ncbi:MAG TPA: hypothetical protein PK530_13880 [Anaerolineales bacterium]|nr:hypothetical protein [Anaerolineales bacterium]